jgi:uncharacterized protein (TIGR02145 family)
MKPHVLFFVAVCSCIALAFATSVSLSGMVLAQDSKAKSGVVVSLSGTTLATTTGDDGTWSLTGATGLVAARSGSATKALSRRVVLDGGRLRLSIGDRDIEGRPLSGASALAGISAMRKTAITLDTLIYSWNGTVILRDTISVDSLTQTGIFRFFDTTVNAAITHGYVVDAQNHLYRTVSIGTRTWMAQNLNMNVDSSWCYDDSIAKCQKYGRLYKWADLMGLADSCNSVSCSTLVSAKQQGICPSQWHVPSDTEWGTLVRDVDSLESATNLKSTSGWSDTGNGTDLYGFHALPAGWRSFEANAFSGVGIGAAFRSTPKHATRHAIYWFVYDASTNVDSIDDWKTWGISARCLKD